MPSPESTHMPVLLIVDDEARLLRNVAAYFEDEGYTVLTAENGEQALEILSVREPHIGIIDISLPGINGNEVILQAGRLHRKMKFIIHTGSSNYHIPPGVEALGVQREHIFIKPVMDMSRLHAIALKMLTE